MKTLLLSLIFAAGAAHAQLDDTAGKGGAHNVNLKVGFSKGGFALGAGYEHMIDAATGVGGEFRTFQKNDSGTNNANGVMVVGATLGHHFYKKAWDLSFTPSFNLISIDAVAGEDATSVGPGLSIGLTWQLNNRVAVGFDNSRYWIWFDEDTRGLVIDDLGVKVKASF